MVKLKLELPEHFLEGETRDGYYVSPEMKKVWAVELDLLNEFMRVCKKHNLRWFADGGTMLGAVRHGGFIPWDDDIDVMMLREEYENFCRIAPLEFKAPYFLQNEYTEPGCALQFSKLRNSQTTGIIKYYFNRHLPENQGIFIDIFPIDNVPLDIEERNAFITKLSNLRNKLIYMRDLTVYYRPKKDCGINKWVKHYLKHAWYMICILFKNSYATIFVELEQECQRYNQTQTEFIEKLILHPITPRRLWKSKWLTDRIFLPFEMLSIPIPIGCESILSQYYDNWHEFVKGGSKHGEMIFDADQSYIEYFKKH